MSSLEVRSILVVGAHPDDECLGAGGTIKKHTEQGVPVDVLCLTGTPERNRELTAACRILGVRSVYSNERDDFAIDWSVERSIVDVILKSRPTLVVTHSSEDYNRNHVSCSRIVSDAIEWASHVTQFANAHRVERILGMEVNSLHSGPNVLIDISSSYEAALAALREHRTQLSKVEGFYERFYEARTKLRGVQAACERAEAFTVLLPTHAGPFYPVNSVSRLV